MNDFFVTSVLALVVATCTANTTKGDLQKALDTKGRIWTVMRSFIRQGESGTHTCIYAWNGTLNGDTYTFDQYYKEGENWKTLSLQGTLSEDSGLNRGVLTVSTPKKETAGIRYTLEYWDGSQHCGILKFTQSDIPQCEVHVWEDHVSSGYENCERVYEEYCGLSTHKHTVYNAGCLNQGQPR
uniref:Lipocalin-2 1 n=1 Tax=Amblyomma tuberculatum TaxID=48802 RepID=A0A6M2E4I6_9ACAR